MKAFFVASLSTALDLGIATGDDVLRHATPEILAAHLPRPLWARLLTACVGAARVDATLVIETVGVPNLCEHLPAPVLWACIAEVGARALGGIFPAVSTTISQPIPALLAPAPAAALLAPMPPTTITPAVPAPVVVGPAIPDADLPPVSGRTRTPTGAGRFRATSTGAGLSRPGTNGDRATPPPQPRRPQAAATTPSAVIEAGTSRARRPATEVSDYDIETDVRAGDDWRQTLGPAAATKDVEVDVDDEQLVDWAASEETVTGGSELDRTKR